MHQGLVPPESVVESEINWEFCEWATEYDVVTTLRKLGHEVLPIGMMGDLKVVRTIIDVATSIAAAMDATVIKGSIVTFCNNRLLECAFFSDTHSLTRSCPSLFRGSVS